MTDVRGRSIYLSLAISAGALGLGPGLCVAQKMAKVPEIRPGYLVGYLPKAATPDSAALLPHPVPWDRRRRRLIRRSPAHNGPMAIRHSLAITLYGDSLRDSSPLSAELEDASTSMLAGLIESDAGSRRLIGARPVSRKAKPR